MDATSATSRHRRNVAFAAWLALHTGLRVGEVCALLRRDVQAARGIVCVGATAVEVRGRGVLRKDKPKTSSSRRNVAITRGDADVIAAHEAWQDGYLGRPGRDTPLCTTGGEVMLSKANGIDFYDVDLCANSERQAKTSFLDLRRVLDRDATEFRRGFSWNGTEIQNTTTQSVLRYWTSNADTKDGLRSGAVFFDEVHQYQSHDQLEVFETGLGKKDCPREAYFSSDGDVRGGVIDEFKEQGRKVLAAPET